MVRFKLLLRDILLRKIFLNGVRFDLREGVNITFLNTYVMGDLCGEDGQRI